MPAYRQRLLVSLLLLLSMSLSAACAATPATTARIPLPTPTSVAASAPPASVTAPQAAGQPTQSVLIPLVVAETPGPAGEQTSPQATPIAATFTTIPAQSAAETTSAGVLVPLVGAESSATASEPTGRPVDAGRTATPASAAPTLTTAPTATTPPGNPTTVLAPIVSAQPVANYTYRVINTYPHDPDAYTQGLVFENGTLYEGTGLIGRSTLRRVDLKTGNVLQSRDLPSNVFGEGIAILNSRIFQLTWQSQIGYVYDRDSFELLGEFGYQTEGWGITHDGTHLIMSDGTATLRFWDPNTFAELGRIEVRDENGPVNRLNELEYIDGMIYANVWMTDRIAQIDPQTGRVLGWIDLTGLLSPEDRPIEGGGVLNGIAYDAASKRLFVTGKLWPKLFEIELVQVQ